MSFYFFPKRVINLIDRIRCAFFWKGTRNIHGGLCLIHWQLVCSHKNQGGLGVCNLRAFNLALLSKWWWRFFNDANAPWVGLVTHNYYRRRRARDLHISLVGHVSPFWRGVLKASTAFATGTNIVVGMDIPLHFGLIIGWIIILLPPNFPTCLCSQRIPHLRSTIKLALLMEEWFRLLFFGDGQTILLEQTYSMTSTPS